MATFTFSGTVLADVALAYAQTVDGSIYEDTTKVFTGFGADFTQGVPPTLTIAVSETSDDITSVGIRYGSTGTFTSEITLTESQAADLSQIQMQVVSGSVDSDSTYDITITTTDP